MASSISPAASQLPATAIVKPIVKRGPRKKPENPWVAALKTDEGKKLTQLLNGLEKLEHLGDLARELSKFTSSITGEEVSDTVVEESHKEVAAEEPKEMIATPKAKKGKKVEIKEVDTEMETPKSAEKPSDEKEVDDKADSKSAAKKRKVRDPNAPKHPLNSYMLFQNKMRPIIKEELTQIIDGNPVSVSNLQLTQELSLRWKSLNEKEKEPYISESRAQSNKYTEDKAEYAKKLQDHCELNDEGSQEELDHEPQPAPKKRKTESKATKATAVPKAAVEATTTVSELAHSEDVESSTLKAAESSSEAEAPAAAPLSPPRTSSADVHQSESELPNSIFSEESLEKVANRKEKKEKKKEKEHKKDKENLEGTEEAADRAKEFKKSRKEKKRREKMEKAKFVVSET